MSCSADDDDDNDDDDLDCYLKFGVFWDVAPCSHVEDDQRFRGSYCLHHQGESLIPRCWSSKHF
jgi:hypothetical protein